MRRLLSVDLDHFARAVVTIARQIGAGRLAIFPQADVDHELAQALVGNPHILALSKILGRQRRTKIGVMRPNQRDPLLPECLAEPTIARLAELARNQAFSIIRAQRAE
jgi:hypothetical protein